MIFDKLKQFRQSAYMLLGKGKDAVCDLIDAVLTTPRVKSWNCHYRQCFGANGRVPTLPYEIADRHDGN